MTLKKTVLNSIFWNFGHEILNKGVTFLVMIILSRILTPSDFGLIGMIGILISIANILVDSGMSNSLIRTINATEEDYSFIFYYNLLVSCLLFITFFLIAPLVSSFFNQPILILIIRLYSIVFIISSFSIIQNTRLTKELKFKKQLIISIPSLIIGSLVGIILAYNNYGVWSLVWSNIARVTVESIQFWFYYKWLPVLKFKLDVIKRHFTFGSKLMISAIIDSTFSNLYSISIGKLFSPMQVGFYNRADVMQQMPVTITSTSLGKVFFPILIQYQNDDLTLKNTLKTILISVFFFLTPILLFMSVLAKPLFILLFTNKWVDSVPFFKILCINGILYPIHSFNLMILNIKGRSDVFLKLEIIKKVLIASTLFFSYKYGIMAMIYSSVVSSVLSLIINTYFTKKLINYSGINQLIDIIPCLLISLLSALVVFYVNHLLSNNNFNNLNIVLLSSLTGLITYIVSAYFFRITIIHDLFKIFKND